MTEQAARSGAPAATVRVLYFAGSGRSGTTVINNILGQVDGAFACGELRYLWQRGIVEDRLCGCGLPFSQCPLWTPVVKEAFAQRGRPDAQAVADRLLQRLSSKRVPAMLVRRLLGRRPVPQHPDDAAITDFYRALSGHIGGGLIVDSSKLPPYGLLLEQQPGIEFSVLHIVRDSRATAFSWQRSKQLLDTGDDQLMPKLAIWKSSVLWAWWNFLTALLWSRSDRYLRVRYEDFVANPKPVMEQIAAMSGLDPAGLPFETPTSVRLAPTHSVAGNPARLSAGAVSVRNDDEWKSALPARQRQLVTAITAPVLAGFGYSLRARKRGSDAA